MSAVDMLLQKNADQCKSKVRYVGNAPANAPKICRLN